MSALTEDFEIIEKEDFSFSDALNPEIEEGLIREFVNLGLEESSPHWNIHEKTKDISIDYKVSKKERIYTIRCSTVISNASIEDYYKFCESNKHYDNNYLSSFLGNEETKIVANIDKNHTVLYSTISPGDYNSYFIAARDFCYVQTRFNFEDYAVKISNIIPDQQHPESKEDEIYDYIVGSFCYTNNNHPFYVNEKEKDNVCRGNLIRSGYILAQLDYNSFRAINIFSADWAGNLPIFYLNNFVMSYNGDKIKKFHHKWFNTIIKSVQERKKKHHKHKHENDENDENDENKNALHI